MAGIELLIGANTSGAISGLQALGLSIDDARKKLESLQDQISKTRVGSSDWKDLTNQAVSLKNSIQQAEAAQRGFTTSLGGVSRAARVAHADFDGMVRSVELLSRGGAGAGEAVSGMIFNFERLSGVSGGVTAGIEALGEAMIGPAGLVLIATTLLPSLGELASKLSEDESAAEKSKKALEGYTTQIENVKKAIEDLKSAMDFSQKLADVNNEIAKFGKIEGLEQQSVANRQYISDLVDQEAKVKQTLTDIKNDQTLSDKDRAEALKKANEEFDALYKAEIDARNHQILLYRLIALQHQKDDDEAHKKELEAYKKYLEDLKKYQEEALKAQLLFKAAKLEALKTEGGPLPAEAIEPVGGPLKLDRLQEGLKQGIIDVPVNIVPEIPPLAFEKEITDVLAKLDKGKFKIPFIAPGTSEVDTLIQLTKSLNMQEDAARLADTITGKLTPAFSTLFSEIEKGGNLGKAVFHALLSVINSVVSELIKAAIKAAVLKSVEAAISSATGGGSFLLGIIGLAEGGEVRGPGTSKSDSVPAMLSAGEYVMNAEAVSKYGVDMMNLINRKRFADGGIVAGSMIVARGDGSLSRARNAIGGSASNNINISLSGAIQGDQLKLFISQIERSQARNF